MPLIKYTQSKELGKKITYTLNYLHYSLFTHIFFYMYTNFIDVFIEK